MHAYRYTRNVSADYLDVTKMIGFLCQHVCYVCMYVRMCVYVYVHRHTHTYIYTVVHATLLRATQMCQKQEDFARSTTF